MADGYIDLRYTPINKIIADGLIKALIKDKFLAFRRTLGLESPI